MRLQTTIRFENSLNHSQLQGDFHEDFFLMFAPLGRLRGCLPVFAWYDLDSYVARKRKKENNNEEILMKPATANNAIRRG